MKFVLVILLTLAVVACSQGIEFAQLKNLNAQRVVELKNQLIKVQTVIRVFNEDKNAVNHYYYAVPQEYDSYLALVLASDKNSKEIVPRRIENQQILSKYNAILYRIDFSHFIEKNGEEQLTITETYFDRLNSLPKKITIFEDQNVEIFDNQYFFSPYPTERVSSTYKLSSAPIFYTEEDGTARGSIIEYGPYRIVEPFKRGQVRLHFEMSKPLPVFKNVTRSIEVSHWGNVAIEDFYELVNQGAELTGENSRVDFNKYSQNTGKNALKNLKANLPYHAWGVSYRDEVGNISTSRASRNLQQNQVEMTIEPRFSLLGGWKSNFYLGYNLPAQYCLYTEKEDPTNYYLRLNFGLLFKGIMAEEYTVKIILPEGASDIQYDIPFKVDSVSNEKTFSYLDIEGRPTLVFKKYHTLDYHDRSYLVQYKFSQDGVIREPLMLLGFFAVLFIFFTIIGRMDFSFGKEKSE